MQNATARARAIETEQQLRLARPAETEAKRQPQTVEPALAVWRLARSTRTNPLPRELACQAISHYTDPGDLVLAPDRRGGELLEQAARLGRRALPLEAALAQSRTAPGTRVAQTVVALRADQGAELVLAPIRTGPCERRLAALLPLLRPGGFLVVTRSARADANRSGGLGSIVRAAQQSGLQYWQHIVALTPGAAGHEPPTRSHPPQMRAPEQDGGRAIRCHHDLLVFRRPAPAEAGVAAAAVAGVAA